MGFKSEIFRWKKYRSCLFIATAACLWLSPSLLFAEHYITGSGCSVSNLGYLTDLAKEYENRTGIKVHVRGGGSVVGIEDLRSGNVDFAAACRPRTSGDPEDIQFIQVAWDALVFIVHPSNPVRNITIRDVRRIYGSEITNWQQLKGKHSPLKVFISRSKKGLSGVEASMQALVLGDREIKKSDRMLFVASSAIVEQMVETTKEGFAATGYISARKRAVKMLSINGVKPASNNIIQKKYALMRPLYILVPKNPKSSVKQFVDFILSNDGQRFIRSLNVVSLLDVK